MRIILSILFFAIFTVCSSQEKPIHKNILIVYGKKIVTNNKKNIKDQRVRYSINSIKKSFEYLEYELIIKDDISQFSLIPFMDNEGININKRAISAGGGESIYFTEKNKDSLYHQMNELFGEIYTVRYPKKV
ncbi:hypothetical protein [Mesonia aestuariivivens]|uniref:DUF4174 domain-containing protein n=1 Tax=Mesonia aestuariivivens TaxID=2796128 RepID=A0ABS6W398_9FLAO|nr:hypothetical protein [Mesonia aestuariivivens]MBW2961589.1 hypothetical protein [Mesonia aestuariivivens]